LASNIKIYPMLDKDDLTIRIINPDAYQIVGFQFNISNLHFDGHKVASTISEAFNSDVSNFKKLDFVTKTGLNGLVVSFSESTNNYITETDFHMKIDVSNHTLLYDPDKGSDICIKNVIVLDENNNKISSNGSCMSTYELIFGDGQGDEPIGCIPGDANNDGHINVTDIVLIVNAILDGVNTVSPGYECYDYNRDGNINVTDIVGIVNLILSGEAP
tara:strand:- start:2358 stop:3005 length:648 start_codon:yes stop_codon:yes gene_type:complete